MEPVIYLKVWSVLQSLKKASSSGCHDLNFGCFKASASQLTVTARMAENMLSIGFKEYLEFIVNVLN